MRIKILPGDHFSFPSLQRSQSLIKTPGSERMGKRPSHVRRMATLIPQPLYRTIWQYLSKLQTHGPFAPASPLLGIYSTDTLPRVWNDLIYCGVVGKSKSLEIP